MHRRGNLSRWILVLTICLLGAGSLALLGDRETSAADKAAERAVPIKVPPGFTIEKVAGPPLVEHPIMAGFDERGRLFVAESAGRNLNAAALLKELPNSIKVLEDSDGDGRFDRSAVFADKMAFPMGALWHDGALYVCAAPSVWKLEDTKGTGVADKRTELVTKFGFTGNAADIHGPFLAPDGRLYWTDGRHGHEIKRPDGTVLQGKAARIFRCKPDGSDIEVVCGGGMDDPVEIAFTSENEPLATVDILIGRPSRIDAIIYCIDGGVYPYAEQVLKEFKRTGDLLPAVADLGWVAPSGLMRYRANVFGPEFRNNLFLAEFNTHKIKRHVLERDGATFKTRSEDFLSSADPDFHPTDVLEDADGSLLVIDTGGWFRNGCPTSRIEKPEIKGGIYRIRRAGAPKIDDPRGLEYKWATMTPIELVRLLDDPRWAVRDRAVHHLGKLGNTPLPALKITVEGSASVRARRNAVWALTRIETREALVLIREALGDRETSVKLAALHAIGLLRDREAMKPLLAMVTKETPEVRRQAATALGRIRNPEAVPAIIEALRIGGDRFLEHALIYALIEINHRPSILNALGAPAPAVRRAALIALDQMDNGGLTRELVTPFLADTDRALQQTAFSIIVNRPEWAKDLTGLLGEWLGQEKLDAVRQENIRSALMALGKELTIQTLISASLKEEKTPAANRVLLLETLGRMPFDKKTKPAWLEALGQSLQQREEAVLRQAVATVRSLNVDGFDDQLRGLIKDTGKPAEVRVAALTTVATRSKQKPALDTPEVFAFLVSRLDKEVPPLSRMAAAEALSHVMLSDSQLESLTQTLASAGPLEMSHLMAVYERPTPLEIGKKLIAALDKSPGLPSLPADTLRRTLKDHPDEIKKLAEPIFKRLEMSLETQRAKLAELKPVLAVGDVARGKEVFHGKRAACVACHLAQGQGGVIGPDLTKIGGIRTGEDLLEAIVFPSASFVRGYEPFTITTADGKLHNGIIARESADALYLVTAERNEVRIPRTAVDTIERGKVSIMPQGLDAQLSRDELSDLIAYLRSLK